MRLGTSKSIVVRMRCLCLWTRVFLYAFGLLLVLLRMPERRRPPPAAGAMILNVLSQQPQQSQVRNLSSGSALDDGAARTARGDKTTADSLPVEEEEEQAEEVMAETRGRKERRDSVTESIVKGVSKSPFIPADSYRCKSARTRGVWTRDRRIPSRKAIDVAFLGKLSRPDRSERRCFRLSPCRHGGVCRAEAASCAPRRGGRGSSDGQDVQGTIGNKRES